VSLLIKGGITKLSELEIDADKDWQAKEIQNLKAIATGMLEGDIAYRGVSVLEKLAADYGVGYNFLHQKNTAGLLRPEWMDIQDIIAYLTGAVNRMIAPPALQIPAPSISLAVAEDHSGGGRVAEKTLTILAPSLNLQEVKSTSVNTVGGAVSHNHDVGDTDETTEANEATPDDMTLLQADGAVEDWYALGYASQFDAICLNVSTVGADITLNTFEYSKGGGSWGTLTPVLDQFNNYETVGKVWFTFERPGDWATDTVAGIANMYWIKLKASATGGGYSQPLGQQAWILVY
jgi:hypothetical protein